MAALLACLVASPVLLLGPAWLASEWVARKGAL
jgi:hypothetical protein